MRKVTVLILGIVGLLGCNTTDPYFASKRMAQLKAAHEARIAQEALTPNLEARNFVAPSKETLNDYLGDNLDQFVVESPIGREVTKNIRLYKKAYLDADTKLLRGLYNSHFEEVELENGKVVAFKNNQNFDINNKIEKYHSINYNIKSISNEMHKDLMNVVLISSYNGKYFTSRYLELFSYIVKENQVKLLRITRTRLSVENPKLLSVNVYVIDAVSKRAIEDALTGKNTDRKIDVLLSSSYKKFPALKDLSIVSIFRDPPAMGSIVKTNIVMSVDGGRFNSESQNIYKVENSNPYFIVANEGFSDHFGIDFKIQIFVDGVFVAERKMTD